MKKRLAALFTCLVILVALAACSSNSKSEEPKYADATAMETIAKGFAARADVINDLEQNGEYAETSKVY